MSDIKKILQDDDHLLFDNNDMFSKEFDSDYRKIRYNTLVIVQKAPPEIQEINLLEQQVSEIFSELTSDGGRVRRNVSSLFLGLGPID